MREKIRGVGLEKRDLKNLILLASPIILSNFLQNLYNLADSYYMGKVGGVELATSSFTSPITQMIVGVGGGVCGRWRSYYKPVGRKR